MGLFGFLGLYLPLCPKYEPPKPPTMVQIVRMGLYVPVTVGLSLV